MQLYAFVKSLTGYYDLPVITPVFWGGYYGDVIASYYTLLQHPQSSYYGLLRGYYDFAMGLLLITPLY